MRRVVCGDKSINVLPQQRLQLYVERDAFCGDAVDCILATSTHKSTAVVD